MRCSSKVNDLEQGLEGGMMIEDATQGGTIPTLNLIMDPALIRDANKNEKANIVALITTNGTLVSALGSIDTLAHTLFHAFQFSSVV